MATIAAFATLLVLGAAISIWQAILARRAESRAIAESEKARRAEAEAKVVLSFFADRVLAAARPAGQAGGLGKDVTVRSAVDAAEPKIAEAFPNQPTDEAAVRFVLGNTYNYLGEPLLAVRQLERALNLRKAELGPDNPETLSSQNSLALAYQAAGRWDLAIPLFQRTLATRAPSSDVNILIASPARRISPWPSGMPVSGTRRSCCSSVRSTSRRPSSVPTTPTHSSPRITSP